MRAQTTFSLKDQLFNAAKVDYLAALLERAYPAFAGETFRTSVLSAFPALELKERIAHITTTLRACLPGPYPDALGIILAALPPALDPDLTDDDYGDFILAPLSLFVAHYGCTDEHLEISLDALRQITKRFSAEDAARYFLNAFPAPTLAFLRACARDDHYHVRRLASECTRPLLPWAQRLTIDYHEPLPILEVLFADRTRYVTRSVANHLNDVSKIDPDLVVATVQRWQKSGAQTQTEMQFITNHALRTLVKRGHAAALQLIGFSGDADITIVELATSTPRVPVGGEFRFSLTLRAQHRQKLLIDYVMTFAGDARRASRKVFRLKQVELGPDESVTITKAHPMRLTTTRSLRLGEHSITLQVNGRPRGRLRFHLIAVLAAILAIACGGADVDRPPPLSTRPADSVLVVFTRAEAPVAVYRAVTGSPDLPAALNALVRGPTDAERADGAWSWFSEATATVVNSVAVDSAGHATIDFHDLRALIPGASSSAGSAMLLHELNGTVFQFPHIRSVEYRINGSCAAFWEWLQYGCQTVARPER